VITERGSVKTRNVVYATNGYTFRLIPELAGTEGGGREEGRMEGREGREKGEKRGGKGTLEVITERGSVKTRNVGGREEEGGRRVANSLPETIVPCKLSPPPLSLPSGKSLEKREGDKRRGRKNGAGRGKKKGGRGGRREGGGSA
jgi:hypothetical protein